MLGKALLSASVSAGPAAYVEDVFSTWLYTGNGSTQTITNGIDLAGEGGLVWIKSRSSASWNNWLFDNSNSFGQGLSSDQTSARANAAIDSVSSTGFTVKAGFNSVNENATTYASWTFRKAAKFFDIVTFTSGTNTNRRISHSLGSAPGMIILKRTDGVGGWLTYHRSIGRDAYLEMNSTAGTGGFTITNIWGTSDPTSTDFGIDETNLTGANRQFVGYVFAHDAGGFGTAGTDSVVKCGSFTPDGSGNATVTLGWEPQWVLYKRSALAENWKLVDNMRGFVVGSGNDAYIFPNTSGAEVATTGISPFSTGFTIEGEAPSSAYIYIAIRRGPMKTPTVGTEVFDADTAVGNAAAQSLITTGFSVDLSITRPTSGGVGARFADRLRGGSSNYYSLLDSTSTAAEANGTGFAYDFAYNTGIRQTVIGPGGSGTELFYNFRRAPGFFDVVAYTSPGTGGYTLNHNLAAVPQFIIVKHRSGAGFYGWAVYHVDRGINKRLNLNLSDAESAFDTYVLNSVPANTTQIVLGNSSDVAYTNGTFIAYLFATCPGVSKVGSYTGTGTTLNIDCGFTAGSRLVLIKRTDSTGNWYIWDSARGIVSGNDPYLLLNSAAAEVTSTDYIDPLSSGFQISSTAPAEINASGGSYIFLAVA